jgi:hypothetical protein
VSIKNSVLAKNGTAGVQANAEVGRCFLRLANLDNGAFERLSRYETALSTFSWRQVGQLLITLDMLRRTP